MLTLRHPGNSFAASFLAYNLNSRTDISTCVFEKTGAGASEQRFTTYLPMISHTPAGDHAYKQLIPFQGLPDPNFW